MFSYLNLNRPDRASCSYLRQDFQGDILTISVRNLIRSMGGEILPGASADDNGGIVQGRTVR